jgi:hypothetical protein
MDNTRWRYVDARGATDPSRLKLVSSHNNFAIAAFGDLDTEKGKIGADRVFDDLFARNVWYLPRPTRVIAQGTRVLFYQSGSGFRGSAIVSNIVEENTRYLLGALLFMPFYRRLLLDECRRFVLPVSIRPIVTDLDFITNKVYWGQAFRATPRSISETDYDAILKFVKEHESNA